MKTIYYANFKVNNSTTLITPLTDTDKARLLKSIRSYAMAERYEGANATWLIWREEVVNSYGMTRRVYVYAGGYRAPRYGKAAHYYVADPADII